MLNSIIALQFGCFNTKFFYFYANPRILNMAIWQTFLNRICKKTLHYNVLDRFKNFCNTEPLSMPVPVYIGITENKFS